MLSLEQRDRQPELMDQPGLDALSHQQALAGLRYTNAWSKTTRVLWRGLRDAGALSPTATPIRVLDVASGGGDVVIRLARWASRRGIALEAHGCDVSATAVAHAAAAAQRANVPGVKFFRLSVLQDRLPDDYDVVLCTLFLHHLVETDAEHLLRRMAAAARRAVLVDDLVRTPLGYVLAWAGVRLLTRSPIIHVDGPLSVRAAFSFVEAQTLAERAGLCGATFRRHWPQRFLLSWKKP